MDVAMNSWLRLVSPIAAAEEPSVALTLVQAVLKTDKMDEIVRDAVMLGVRAIQPIVNARSETTVATLLKSTRVDRWRRVALASVKQSKRAVLPEVRMPLSFDTFLEEPAEEMRLMLVEPGAAGEAASLADVRQKPTPKDAAVLVGPEGGWTEREWTAARVHGALLVTLGHRTLRADAVPVAAISVLQFLWGDL
jgi:16S rRNA (uracil1498-N3)-methyltransferase